MAQADIHTVLQLMVAMEPATRNLNPASRLWSATCVKYPTMSILCSFYLCFQLPWSTANEDLVELFETTGQVETAEILFDGTRSKGCGVVQFGQVSEAETAIGNTSLSCKACLKI